MKPRLISLDFFRGFTTALMIVVNDPGSWEHVFAPLRHAAWNGATLADLVFPFIYLLLAFQSRYRYPKLKNRSSQRI